MAEIGNQDQPTLPTKRKLDPDCVDRRAEVECEHGHSNKAQKVQSLATTYDNDNDDDNNSEHSPCAVAQQANQSTERCTTNSGFDSLKPQVNIENPEREAIGHEEDEEEEEEEEEEVNGKDVVVDRKGKGIIMEDDEDDSDDDDSSDAGSEFDGHDGSELEDDPLAEIDLDNILPSRTRRRAVQPGVYIANDIISSDDDDDDDDSDD